MRTTAIVRTKLWLRKNNHGAKNEILSRFSRKADGCLLPSRQNCKYESYRYCAFRAINACKLQLNDISICKGFFVMKIVLFLMKKNQKLQVLDFWLQNLYMLRNYFSCTWERCVIVLFPLFLHIKQVGESFSVTSE